MSQNAISNRLRGFPFHFWCVSKGNDILLKVEQTNELSHITFNSFDGDRERHVELPQKKSKIPANRVALVAMGLLQEPKNRPSGAGIDPTRRLLTIITAHNSRICGQPGQQSGIPQKIVQIIDRSL